MNDAEYQCKCVDYRALSAKRVQRNVIQQHFLDRLFSSVDVTLTRNYRPFFSIHLVCVCVCVYVGTLPAYIILYREEWRQTIQFYGEETNRKKLCVCVLMCGEGRLSEKEKEKK